MAHSIYIDKIETAKTVLELYINKPLIEVPAQITSSTQRHALTCHLELLKEWYDEIVIQIDEIRSSKTRIAEIMQHAAPADRLIINNDYLQNINTIELQDFQNSCNIRLEKIRDRKYQIQMLLDTNSTNRQTRRNIALPALTLHEFNGSDWENFWPLFESTIHLDVSLDPVQKMTYLDSLLRDEAKKAIQGLVPFSSNNYDTAIELLKNKYGKEENLIRDLHNKLSRLPASRNTHDDESLQIEIERICRQLENYSQDLSTPQIYLNLEQKISKKVLQKYIEKKLANPLKNSWSTTLFRQTFQEAIEQIKQVDEIYERGNREKNEYKSRNENERYSTMNLAVKYKNVKQNKDNNSSNKRYPNNLRNMSSSSKSSQSSFNSQSPQRRSSPWPTNDQKGSDTESLKYNNRNRDYNKYRDRNRGYGREARYRDRKHDVRGRRYRYGSSSRSQSRSSSSRSPARYPCAFCDRQHFPLDCRKYKNVAERTERCKTRELCIICLKKGHNIQKCMNYYKKCFLCKSIGHNPALCDRRRKYVQSSATTTEDEKDPDKPVTSISTSLRSCQKDPGEIQSLLKCIEVCIYNPLKPTEGHLLLHS
uniref:Uncharacterized protein n=1 Tax=Meloidogyne incognita TaxID=6306 RepID=A0A914KUQ8_MELIC